MLFSLEVFLFYFLALQEGAWGFLALPSRRHEVVRGVLSTSTITHHRHRLRHHHDNKRPFQVRGTIVSVGAATNRDMIDYQASDAYGRGQEHLTASLNEGDVVVYQTGTWYVDGVAVGDGNPAAWQYCLVDTIQIVWSHNCEHGVVRGFALNTAADGGGDDDDNNDDKTTILRVTDFDTMIDFGPEQLVARIPVEQKSVDTFCSLVELSDDLWRAAQESSTY